MPLSPGARLGPYVIVAPLGAGGMGEVYRARDSKLDRDVAVKVLPERVAQDDEARSRFEREAKIVGSLSHPNILAIHDFGAQDGVAYAVMELLEGETLHDRLEGGALPLKKCVDHALQIARGLAAAHEKGVVHRDLKPQNIFVTPQGHVKILDFGLARAVVPQDDDEVLATHTRLTEPGTVLGTVGYMSPEQVRGRSRRPPVGPVRPGRRPLRNAHRASAPSGATRRPRRWPRSSRRSLRSCSRSIRVFPPSWSPSSSTVSPRIPRPGSSRPATWPSSWSWPWGSRGPTSAPRNLRLRRANSVGAPARLGARAA